MVSSGKIESDSNRVSWIKTLNLINTLTSLGLIAPFAIVNAMGGHFIVSMPIFFMTMIFIDALCRIVNLGLAWQVETPRERAMRIFNIIPDICFGIGGICVLSGLRLGAIWACQIGDWSFALVLILAAVICVHQLANDSDQASVDTDSKPQDDQKNITIRRESTAIKILKVFSFCVVAIGLIASGLESHTFSGIIHGRGHKIFIVIMLGMTVLGGSLAIFSACREALFNENAADDEAYANRKFYYEWGTGTVTAILTGMSVGLSAAYLPVDMGAMLFLLISSGFIIGGLTLGQVGARVYQIFTPPESPALSDKRPKDQVLQQEKDPLLVNQRVETDFSLRQ